MDTENIDDHLLIEGCQKKDRKFQEILYRKFAKKMYGICLTYANNRSNAQDILQDGFMKIFMKIDGFNNEGSLEGWVRKIIVNTAIDYFRRTQREYKFVSLEDTEEQQELSNNVMDQVKKEELLGHLHQLPEGARLIFNLYAVEGYTHKEIAQKLEITVGTSKSQLSRAKVLLRKMLNDLNIKLI